jgi:AcrR family transcriptional regulator
MTLPGAPSGPSSSDSMRKLPTQDRAQRTIETIFQATAQIVESEGEAGLTTNKVAKKAGFSIGTLYQYFPSKEAILLAMINRDPQRFAGRLAPAGYTRV